MHNKLQYYLVWHQCMGYLLAATGPIVFGFLHERTGSWYAPLLMVSSFCIILIVLALFAGRSHVIVRTKDGKDIVIDDTKKQIESY